MARPQFTLRRLVIVTTICAACLAVLHRPLPIVLATVVATVTVAVGGTGFGLLVFATSLANSKSVLAKFSAFLAATTGLVLLGVVLLMVLFSIASIVGDWL